MDYENYFTNIISTIKTEGRYRHFRSLERLSENFPQAILHGNCDKSITPTEVTVWCSNDYLGMSCHPAVQQAMINRLSHSGAGAGGTRNIAGTSIAHVQLEKALASWHNKQASLLFGSGYNANLAALETLGRILPNCHIFSDQSNHASMIDGIRRAQCHKHIFLHNDMRSLQQQLQSAPITASKIIAIESVYSMDGDIAPLADIVSLARRYNALIYLDEVHAVGLYGKNGAGIAEQTGLTSEIDIIQGTLAKSFGLIGGYIAGRSALVDVIRSCASPFIFSTALPPMIADGALAALEVIKTGGSLRKTLHDNADFMRMQLSEQNIPFIKTITQIIPIIIGNANLCQHITHDLLTQYNHYLQPINYPTVPRGQERMRLTVSPFHNKTLITDFTIRLGQLWKQYNLQTNLMAV